MSKSTVRARERVKELRVTEIMCEKASNKVGVRVRESELRSKNELRKSNLKKDVNSGLRMATG